MKIVCRTVTGASTNFDVEPSETIGNIKQRMAGEYELASLRLCHKGKVLDDAKTMADLGFNDGEVLIIAGKKAKPGAAAATAPVPAPVEQPLPSPAGGQPASPAAEATPAAAPASAPAAATPASSTASQQGSTASPQQSAAPAAPAANNSNELPPGVDAGTVEMIMAMGFEDKAAVIHALRCAFGNGDRAVEYLFNGIPPGVEAQMRQQQQQQQQPRAAPQQSRPAAPSGGSAGTPQQQQASSPGGAMTAEALGQMMAEMQNGSQGGTPLRRALSSIPQFEQIRALVRQNSAALPTVMQQLQQHHPEVFQLVQANPQEFLDIINEAPTQGGGGGRGGAAAQGDDAAPQLQPLTPADQPAIERLVALGGGQWDARAAGLVYMVCQKNEELAANVLFDNGGAPAELIQALENQAAMMGDGSDSDAEGEA